jgi:xanthine dehydrogenase iron-sulfur cluster and FAD-binding subunit A
MALIQSSNNGNIVKQLEVADIQYSESPSLSPLQKFMFGIKSSDAKRQYPKLLEKFLNFISLTGTIEEKCFTFYKLAKKNPENIQNQLTVFIILQSQRVHKKEIAAGTQKLY